MKEQDYSSPAAVLNDTCMKPAPAAAVLNGTCMKPAPAVAVLNGTCMMPAAVLNGTSLKPSPAAPMKTAIRTTATLARTMLAGAFLMLMLMLPTSPALAWGLDDLLEPPICPFCSCNDKFMFSVYVENEPTCTVPGSYYFYCNCCHTDITPGTFGVSEEIPALGHDWSGITHVDATCTEAGGDVRTCNRCRATEWQNTIPATGHTWSTDGSCSVCGIGSPLTLEVSTSNETALADYHNKICEVTLSGRTLFKDGAWNTLCLPFALSETELATSPLAGADIKELDTDSDINGHRTGADGSTLYLNFKDASSLVAGRPYIVRWTPDDSTPDLTDPVFSHVTVTASIPSTVISLDNSIHFTGIFNPLNISHEDRSILFLGAGSTLYYPNAEMDLISCTAYFLLNGITAGDPSNPTNVTEFRLNFGSDATAVKRLAADPSRDGGEETLSPFLHEGMGETYDLSGRRFDGEPTAPGLYIRQGRKVLVK